MKKTMVLLTCLVTFKLSTTVHFSNENIENCYKNLERYCNQANPSFDLRKSAECKKAIAFLKAYLGDQQKHPSDYKDGITERTKKDLKKYIQKHNKSYPTCKRF